MAPNLFHRIQLWRVRRQILKMDSVSAPAADTTLGCAVSVEAIPNDEQVPLDVALNPAQKQNNAVGVDILIVDAEVETQPPPIRGHCDGTDDR
jgi:hypothetical protein